MSYETNPDAGVLLAIVERRAGEDFLRALLACALHQVMEAEVGEIAGAGKGELAPKSTRPGATATAVATGTLGSARTRRHL